MISISEMYINALRERAENAEAKLAGVSAERDAWKELAEAREDMIVALRVANHKWGGAASDRILAAKVAIAALQAAPAQPQPQAGEGTK